MFSFASRLMSSVWDDCMLLTVSCVLTCTGINKQSFSSWPFLVQQFRQRTQRRTRYNGAVISRGSLLERRQFVRRGIAAG